MHQVDIIYQEDRIKWIMDTCYYPYVKRVNKNSNDFKVYHKLNKLGETEYPKLKGHIFDIDKVSDLVSHSVYNAVGMDPLMIAHNWQVKFEKEYKI